MNANSSIMKERQEESKLLQLEEQPLEIRLSKVVSTTKANRQKLKDELLQDSSRNKKSKSKKPRKPSASPTL